MESQLSSSKASLFVITWLSRARLSPEVTARMASMMRTREEPEIVLELFLRVAFAQAPPNRKPGWTSILLLDSVQGAWPLYQQSPNLGRGSFFNTLLLRSTLEMVSEKEGPLDSDTFSGIHKRRNYEEEDPKGLDFLRMID